MNLGTTSIVFVIYVAINIHLNTTPTPRISAHSDPFFAFGSIFKMFICGHNRQIRVDTYCGHTFPSLCPQNLPVDDTTTQVHVDTLSTHTLGFEEKTSLNFNHPTFVSRKIQPLLLFPLKNSRKLRIFLQKLQIVDTV